MTIQNARSNTSGRVPTSLQDGQIAINQADGVLFSRNPDGTIKRNLLAKRYGVADAAFTVRGFDAYVGIASLTASRALGLPAASAYPPGSPLTIADESGAVSPTVTLTITAAGADKINGASTLAMATAFGGTLLYSDGISKWTAIALPGGAASNAVLFVPQSISAGAQDQARLNVSGPSAATPSATNALAALDFDRDQFVTGTSTITMPSAVAPGWRSGVIANSNVSTGSVTLAVPSGNTLNGVTNGVTVLAPYQRARLQLVSAGAWRTSWIDRRPIVASLASLAGLGSANFVLPAGYTSYDWEINNGVNDTAGAVAAIRLSLDGTTYKTGTSDYFNEIIYTDTSSGNAQAVNGANFYHDIATGLGAANATGLSAKGRITSGSAATKAGITSAIHYLSSSNNISRENRGRLETVGAVAAMQFIVTSGTFTQGSVIIWGNAA